MLCVDAHVLTCISIVFVDWLCGTRLAFHSVVVVCRLFVPHCDVDAYSTHARLAHKHHGRTLVKLALVNEAKITVALYQYI